jgi:hypothetical protein
MFTRHRFNYPISNSKWVNLVHCLFKKWGFIVVQNENNKLIPTRTIVDIECALKEVSLAHLVREVDVQPSYPGSSLQRREFGFLLKKRCRGFPYRISFQKKLNVHWLHEVEQGETKGWLHAAIHGPNVIKSHEALLLWLPRYIPRLLPNKYSSRRPRNSNIHIYV